MDTETQTKKCSICKKMFSGWDNTAWPINHGLCCKECNELVSEARMNEIRNNDATPRSSWQILRADLNVLWLELRGFFYRHAIVKRVVVGLLLLLTIVALYWVASVSSSTQDIVATPTYEMTQEDYNDMYLKVATDGRREAVEGLGDPAFSTYMFDVLDKRCPFYEPDGATYRDCLWDVVNEKEAAYKKGSPSIKEINDYCQSVASNFGNLLSIEIHSSCRAYKLSAK